MRLFITGVFALLITAVPAVVLADEADALTLQSLSQPSGFSVSMRSELNPLEINRMHSWVIRLHDSNGIAIADAMITLSGGMATHDHGLPTDPQVTTYLGDGAYQVEGMRFHMQGDWQLQINIERQGKIDLVEFALTI